MEALYNFIRTNMPRPAPGSLPEEDYLALSNFIWDVLGTDEGPADPTPIGASNIP